jgi:hypothetical protein
MSFLPKHTVRNVACGMFFLTLLSLIGAFGYYNATGGAILGTSMIGYAWVTLELDAEGL